MSHADPAAGLYGKIPGFSDYFHRRLPSSFVEPWNAWISASLARSRDLLGGPWMQAYLTSPPWRFVVEPGILGPRGWVGVLASSVDKVGRCYPITAAAALGADMRIHWLGDGIGRLAEELEAVVLELIDGRLAPDGAVARIDALVPLAERQATPVPLLGRGGAERLMVGSAPSHLAGLSLRWLSEAWAGSEHQALSAWWHGGWNGLPPANLVTAGLPTADAFAGFLDGAWTERDWTEQFEEGRSA